MAKGQTTYKSAKQGAKQDELGDIFPETERSHSIANTSINNSI